MSYGLGLKSLSTHIKLVAAALALAATGALHAGTQVGGGAALSSILYVGVAAANPNTPQVTDHTFVVGTGAIATGSLLGMYDSTTGNTSSYCLIGEGISKNIFAGIAHNSVQDFCPTSSNGGVTLYGFGAPSVGRADLVQPNFVGADTPLNQSDFANYISNHGGNLPVQFPVAIGSVAIAFNLLDNTGTEVTSSEVNFSDLQVCLIFSGTVSTWSDSRLKSAFTLPPGHFLPTNPINVQYPSGSSGTSFAFSNHLSAVCNSSILFSGTPFETSQNFFDTSTSPFVIQSFFNTAVPTNWTGSPGDATIAKAIAVTPNSIGYLGTANAGHTFDSNGNPLALQIADVNGKSPVSDFNVPTLSGLSLAADQLISGTNNSDGTPALSTISPLPSTRCIMTVRPARYAAPSSVAGSLLPIGSYPIVAVSYFLGNSVGNGADLAATQGLVTSPYNSAITSQVTPISGLQFFTLGTVPFTPSQVSACYGL